LVLTSAYLWNYPSDHQYADRPSMQKFDKQTPSMEKI